jgi:hypothetical protein
MQCIMRATFFARSFLGFPHDRDAAFAAPHQSGAKLNALQRSRSTLVQHPSSMFFGKSTSATIIKSLQIIIQVGLLRTFVDTKNLITAVGLTCLALSASAAPPLASDDASTLGAGECQFETEHRQFRHRLEQDIGTACNLFFDTEFGISHQRVASKDSPRADSIAWQFKKVLATSAEAGWAFGFVAATVQARGNESGTRQNLVNALVSRKIGDTNLHLNAGIVSDHEAAPGTRKNRPSWAIATEHDATERWTLVGEVFGQRGVPAVAQIGARWWVVPRHVQFTTSLGAQRGEGREGRWASFGVRFETGKSIF